jgi:hypothetical protein
MFVLMNAADHREALTTELLAEFSRLRAIGMKLAGEIERQVDENPDLAADGDIVLRFQRIATAVSRLGGLQLMLLDGQLNFAQAAEEVRRRNAAVHLRERARAGKELKAKCAYMFDKGVLEDLSDTIGPSDLETMRKDLMTWLFEADPLDCASKSVGDIMIEITRALGIEPKYGPEETAEWEAAMRERWAPLDQARGFDPSKPPPELPGEPYRSPAFDLSWVEPDTLVPI